MKCEICNKKVQFACRVSYSKRHTKRRQLPNIQRLRLIIDGKRRRVKICTRCLRTQYKLAR